MKVSTVAKCGRAQGRRRVDECALEALCSASKVGARATVADPIRRSFAPGAVALARPLAVVRASVAISGLAVVRQLMRCTLGRPVALPVVATGAIARGCRVTSAATLIPVWGARPRSLSPAQSRRIQISRMAPQLPCSATSAITTLATIPSVAAIVVEAGATPSRIIKDTRRPLMHIRNVADRSPCPIDDQIVSAAFDKSLRLICTCERDLRDLRMLAEQNLNLWSGDDNHAGEEAWRFPAEAARRPGVPPHCRSPGRQPRCSVRSHEAGG